MNKNEQITFYTNLVTGSAITCVLIALLLLLNYRQISKSEPLESITMTTLLERLEEEPDNEELIQEIRNLDLMARKAFFNNQWQINTGALLLLISGIVLGFSLNALTKLKSGIEMPDEENKETYLIRKLSQRGIQISGAVLLLLALGASYFSVDHLKTFDASISHTNDETTPTAEAEQIEIIDISTGPPVEEVQTESDPAEDLIVEEIETAETPEPIVEEESAAPPAPEYPTIANVYSQHGSFRGPLGNGVSFKKDIPTEWNGTEGTNVLWKVKLPKKGKNSPVIWGSQLYLAAADDSGQAVYCYNRHSGTLLWQKNIKPSGSPVKPPKVTEDTGYSAATVTTNGVRVYAIFATGDIAALDPSGNILWAKNLGIPDNHYGHSSSLLSWQEKVFVQYDTNKGAKVLALNGQSGETIWETVRNVRCSWASPILVPVDDSFQLILSADPTVAAYDINTGKELWSNSCMMGEVGPSPAFGNGLIFVANEYATLAAIRPGGTIVWQDNEYLPEVASPVVSDGLLYIATSYGVLACYDAKSGEKQWEHEAYAGFYSSPVIADGKVYAIDTEGTMLIFSNSREKNLIGEPALGEGAVTTPAFASGKIYIRGEEHLYCIGE